MPRPLEYKRRVRMLVPEELPMPRPRRSFALVVGLGAWLAAVAVAWGVEAGTIPVAKWLEPQPEARGTKPSARRATRPVPAPAVLLARAAPSPNSPALPPPEPVPAFADPSPLPPAPPAPAAGTAVTLPPIAHGEPAGPSIEPTRSGPIPDPDGTEPNPGSTDGTTCEAALAAHAQEIEIGGDRSPPDLSAADYASVLDRGSYLAGCGVSEHASIDVCVAVQNGRAKGVTVRASPRNVAAERCIARAVRRLAFPSHPRLDVARTHFE